jgi:hypothetical protein
VGLPVNLSELTKLINNILEGDVEKQVMENWIGNKILDWNDVLERLENVYMQ